MEIQDVFKFTNADVEMLLEALDSLKSKDFAGEMMSVMFEGLIKPKEGATAKEIEAYEQHKKKQEAEKIIREEKQKKVKKEIDILKSKITLMQSMKENQDLEVNLKKSERQIA